MSVKFVSPAVFVTDMDASRRFYEELMGQKVMMAVDRYVAFEGEFALWHVDSVKERVYGGSAPKLTHDGPGCEMYFETEELDAEHERIAGTGIELIHGLQEMPWGQRCFRLYDPDGYVVELGEPMTVVVRRFLDQGLSVAEVHEKSLMPEPFIEAVKNGMDPAGG